MFRPLFTPEQRALIERLKARGLSGAEVARACAEGVDGFEPFEVSVTTANRIAREAREESRRASYADYAPREALGRLARRLILVADREIKSLEDARYGPVEKITKLAQALTRLEVLTRGLEDDAPQTADGNGGGFWERIDD